VPISLVSLDPEEMKEAIARADELSKNFPTEKELILNELFFRIFQTLRKRGYSPSYILQEVKADENEDCEGYDALYLSKKIIGVRRKRLVVVNNKRVVFVGKLETMTLQEAKQMAEKQGAWVDTTITTKTGVVVCGGTKITEPQFFKARSAGATIMFEAEFVDAMTKQPKFATLW
jgi:NAD-dependent DNA ligase